MLGLVQCRPGAILTYRHVSRRVLVVPFQQRFKHELPVVHGSGRLTTPSVIEYLEFKSKASKNGGYKRPGHDDEKHRKQGKRQIATASETPQVAHHPKDLVISRLYTKEDESFTDLDLRPLEYFPDTDLSSSRPAKLESPNPPNAEDYEGSVPLKIRATYFYQLGRSYLKFYKTGLKNIWTNCKESRVIRKVTRRSRLTDAAHYSRTLGTLSTTGEDYNVPSISRREFQLCLRTSHDIRKLAPFALIFCIFGEFTPLVILAIGSAAVPYTCRIPKQQKQDLERFYNARRKMVEELTKLTENLPHGRNNQYDGNPRSAGSELEWRTMFIKAYAIGINPFSKPVPLIGKAWWRIWCLPGLIDWGKEVLADVVLVRREGGYGRLEPIEVTMCALKYFHRDCLAPLSRRMAEDGGFDPHSEELKRELVPILEQHADRMLSYDWTLIPYGARWQVPLWCT